MTIDDSINSLLKPEKNFKLEMKGNPMNTHSVSFVKYEKPFESVEKALTLAGGFEW